MLQVKPGVIRLYLGSEILYNGQMQDQEAGPHLERGPGVILRSIWRVLWAGSVDFKPGIYTAAEEKEGDPSLSGTACKGSCGRRKGSPRVAGHAVWRSSTQEPGETSGALSHPLDPCEPGGPTQALPQGPQALGTLPLVINAEAWQPGYRVSLQKFLQANDTFARILG